MTQATDRHLRSSVANKTATITIPIRATHCIIESGMVSDLSRLERRQRGHPKLGACVRRGHVVREYRRSGDQQIRPGTHDPRRGVLVDPAVNRDVHFHSRILRQLPRLRDLGQHGLNKALSAKAGIDRHDQDFVYVADDVLQRADGR